tara:strand:+ start:17211 stop:18605 length:1395 start_codon:yes stop_codon:yes gene_type:complete
MIFTKTIKTQLVFIALTPLLLVIALVSSYVLFESIVDIEDELNKKAKNITSQAMLMADFYFYTGDTKKLGEVADLLKHSDEIVFIRFLDSLGQLLVERKKPHGSVQIKTYFTPVFSKSPRLDDFNVASPNNETLGYIEIGLSRAIVTAKQNNAYYKGLIISLLSLIVGVILIYLFSRRFSLAMTSLINTATEIEQGNFDQRCLENGSGELFSFQQNFNYMIQSLQINEQELQAKIISATKALNESLDELSIKNAELDKTRHEAITLERSKAIADERTRIMKDMHDGIGGQLVASLALLELEQDSTIRNKISTILFECLDDFRLIINSLNVYSNTLSALLADFKYRMNPKLDNMSITLNWKVMDLPDDIILQPQQGLHLLRVLQESFTNILKHANATHIIFQATIKDNVILLMIEDNGHCGSSKDVVYGNGINNMKWRVNELQGNFSIHHESGGCRITMSIPLPE